MTAIHAPFRRPYHVPFSLAFSGDGQTLATVDNGELHLWSAASGVEQHLPKPIRCSSVAFSPDGRDLAVGGSRLALCDRLTGQPIVFFQPEEKFPRCLTFSPDSRLLASCIEKEVNKHKMAIIIHLWDEVLKKLAGGAPGTRLTRDAKLALQRLERRKIKP